MGCAVCPDARLTVDQEAGRRAGTENVLGIVGLGAAAEIVTQEQAATAAHMAEMRDSLQQRLLHAWPQVNSSSQLQGYVRLAEHCHLL